MFAIQSMNDNSKRIDDSKVLLRCEVKMKSIKKAPYLRDFIDVFSHI